MSDKNKDNKNGQGQQADQKKPDAQPKSGVGQHIPNDKGVANEQGNAAGQGNEGDEVMPAGRETPG